MSGPASVTLELPSEVRLVDVVHSAAEKMAEFAGFDEDIALNVGLAVREAVINAMLHGNRKDPGRSVTVTLTADGTELVARVVDQGDGFDPEETPDPTEGDNLLRTSGRGLLLIRAFVDEVVFERAPEGGTVIVMKKTRPAEADEAGS